MPKITVETGVQLYVEDWGQGQPIVLIHGWPADHRIFEFHMLRLARQGFRAVAIDLRGFGDSDKPWHGHDYDTWARDIGAVFQRLDLQDVLLVGYSMGGAIAAHYLATSHDPRVTRLALLSAALPAAAPRPQDKTPYTNAIREVQMDRAQMALNYFTSMGAAAPLPAALAHYLQHLTFHASLWAMVRGLEELRDRDLSDELRAITVPVRILHGVLDNNIPFALAETQHRLVPSATLIPFADSDHNLIYFHQERIVEELAAFATQGGQAQAA
jgi:pimeloyl-ACP methyl ester carboxylesterase